MCKSCSPNKGEDLVHSHRPGSHDSDEKGRLTLELWRKRDDTNGYAGKNLPGDRQYKRTGQSDGFGVGTPARDRHPGVPGQAAWGSGPAEIKAASPAATVDLLLLDLSVQH